MKKLYYAHYPALQACFVRFVREHRASPLDKWLVVTASSWMAQSLQTCLAREQGTLANIHFVTGSSLVSQLDSEAPGQTLPLLPQNHVRDFLIEQILCTPGLERYPLSVGLVQAVKSALRDLEDSLADPAVLEEHWHSMPDFVLEQDGGRFEWLIKVYRAYCEQENRLPGYRSYQQAFERALNQVEKSPYLRSFSHILIYGFYDMPGRQWELLSRVRNAYPVTVFAPYAKHPAYQFAQKFFETNWMGVPGAENVNVPFTGALGRSADYLFSAGGSSPNVQVQITSVPDINGSVFYAAKEILKLISRGTATQDIAVIVRTLTPYQDEIRRVFKNNCLPLDASFTYPFTHYALGNFILNLLNLTANGFARENVLAIFSSPYFKNKDKVAWCRLVRKSAVQRDLTQWDDLLDVTHNMTSSLKQWLFQTAQTLQTFETVQSWETGTAKIWEFLQTQVDVTCLQGKDTEIFDAVQETLAQMKGYQAIRKQSRKGELLRQTVEALNELAFNEAESIRGGITVTDAIRARGLSFKYVFLLGLNDREFPLITPEDPILRDYYRVVLRDTLGYWINPSLDRGEEEKLLFYNAVTTAQNYLYVTYARYEADGKPAIPSVYMAELARVCELNLQAADAPRISGRTAERLSACELSFLTPQELSYQIVLRPQSVENFRQAGLLDEAKLRSLTAARALVTLGELGAYDGVISNASAIFKRQNARGFSPSALEELGQCPLKYFFNRVLHLAEPEEPASRYELAADTRGTLYHQVLQDFYQTLYQKKLTHNLFDEAAAYYLAESFDKFYNISSYKNFGIYPVVWELILENLKRTLTDFVQQDLKNLGMFTPTFFEQEVSPVSIPDLPFKLRGIIDRIDVNAKSKQFYVADYKSTRKSTRLTEDVFTQLILQPFVYVLLAPTVQELADYTSAGSCLLTIAKYKKTELSTQDFADIYKRVCALLVQLACLIQNGTFFMRPSDKCRYCPYGLLCRKDAFKSLLRARKSKPFVQLEEVRHAA
ncbi:MAG: exodeoxyribonuclease V subunit gamma [Elusimicrobiaceae bacterium]|nr:exodeoxyribonuclease V subunit gamma [Elusimicrobiaceae bacterium]